ncbi:MAG TPA: hypothetical protein VG889_18730 [Rhizomicrobium sp.]|nr:hypothetical protein [Rhizomicrobium sp.]
MPISVLIDGEHTVARVLSGFRFVTDLGVAFVASDLVSIALGPSPSSVQFDIGQRLGLIAAAIGLVRIVFSFVVLHQNKVFEAFLSTPKTGKWQALLGFDCLQLVCSLVLLLLVGFMAYVVSHPADTPFILRAVASRINENYGASNDLINSLAVSFSILACILGIYPVLLISEALMVWRLQDRQKQGTSEAFRIFSDKGAALIRTTRIWCYIDLIAFAVLLLFAVYFWMFFPSTPNVPQASSLITQTQIVSFGSGLRAVAPLLEALFTLVAVVLTFVDISCNSEFYSPSAVAARVKRNGYEIDL